MENNKNQTNFWHIQLIVEEIFENLDLFDLQRCAGVCRLWKKISIDVRRRRDLEEQMGPSHVSYNEDLDELETLMTTVEQLGTFFVRDFVDICYEKKPKIDVEGVGTLFFPISSKEAKQLIEQSVRVPYSREGKAVVDLSVRKVWQLSPEKVHIVDDSWSGYLSKILFKVQAGLGCQDASISAELDKLLVYDEGSFYKPHCDTKKAANMFGTLVVVLPSDHCGGELNLCHGKMQVQCNLSHLEEFEIAFTAFYSDCTHEVLPILYGNRVCLVYNLLQQTSAGETFQKGLVAPNYDKEIKEVAEILKNTLTYPEVPSAPKKIVWLLEHYYREDLLLFQSLRNAGYAFSRVFLEAAVIAKCDIYVTRAHLTEWALLQCQNNTGRFPKYKYCIDWEMHYLNDFVTSANEGVNLSPQVIEEKEVLPNGALYCQDPYGIQKFPYSWRNNPYSWRKYPFILDEVLEYSYHRAALVICRHDYYSVSSKKRKIPLSGACEICR